MDKEQTTVRITSDVLKTQKTLTCECGGITFVPGFVFKKISPLISPSGKEQLYPIEILVCQKCGKVPQEFNERGLLPNEVLSK